MGVMQGMPPLPAGGPSKTLPAADDDDDDGQAPQQLELASLAVLCRRGCVKGYSRTVVRLSFTPPTAGPVRQHICIHFR